MNVANLFLHTYIFKAGTKLSQCPPCWIWLGKWFFGECVLFISVLQEDFSYCFAKYPFVVRIPVLMKPFLISFYSFVWIT